LSYNARDLDAKEALMAKQITCECGRVIRGATDNEVIEAAREHMRQDHPELVDKVTLDDLRSWIEEV